eukprot:m.484044 g.484044  ORF g.484044 m.484044 type:complete len:340 (-) comp23166_c0_seq1:86-1105(-)
MMAWAGVVVVALAAAVHGAAVRDGAAKYVAVPGWPSAMPSGAAAGPFTAMAIVQDRVFVAQRGVQYDQPLLVFSKDGTQLLATTGNTTVSKDSEKWGVHGLASVSQTASASLSQAMTRSPWLTDVTAHVIDVLSPDGTKIDSVGTSGTAGNQTDPLQFGNIADVAFDRNGGVYYSDGDGGVNNRVVGSYIARPSKTKFIVDGKPNHPFSSPHSITHHDRTSMLFVADRGNNRTQLLSSINGQYLGEWTCMRPGTPWGLRVYQAGELLIQADGNSQRLTIYSTKNVKYMKPGACDVVQTIDIPQEQCNTPHEMAVDNANGDIYLACVGTPNSGVMKFTLQ